MTFKNARFPFAFSIFVFVLSFCKTPAALADAKALTGTFYNSGAQQTFFLRTESELENVTLTAFGTQSLPMIAYASEMKDGKAIFVYGSQYSYQVSLGKNLLQVHAQLKSGVARKIRIEESFDVTQDTTTGVLSAVQASHVESTDDPADDSWMSFPELALAHGGLKTATSRRMFLKFPKGHIPENVTICLDGQNRCLNKNGRRVATEKWEIPGGETLLASSSEIQLFDGLYVTIIDEQKPLLALKYQVKPEENRFTPTVTQELGGQTVYASYIRDWLNTSGPDANLNGYADKFDGDLGDLASNNCSHYASRACAQLRAWKIPCKTVWYNIPGYKHACIRFFAENKWHYLEPQLNRNFGLPGGSNTVYAEGD